MTNVEIDLQNTLKLTMDPFENFRQWFALARENMGEEMATAMTLATVSDKGEPRARVVLLKRISRDQSGQQGFCFFTNFDSPKGLELTQNGHAALVFFWPALGKQIRIEGSVVRLNETEADAYFKSRPRGSQIGAWASPQSQKINSREELVQRVSEVEARFADAEVPRPQNWGGWFLLPSRFEFWQAGEFRLHDRFLFSRKNDGGWDCSRLAP
jgi:pyridoxamine 5'-phosphate oxidase